MKMYLSLVSILFFMGFLKHPIKENGYTCLGISIFLMVIMIGGKYKEIK